jgi:phage shock protein E
VRSRVLTTLVAVLGVLAAGCGGGAATATQAQAIETVSPAQAADLVASPPAGLVVLDVRTPDEFASGHLAGAVNLDFYSASFATDLAALNRDVPYLIYCHTGNRSGQTREMMRQLGFERVYDLQGGIAAWQAAGQPITP